MAEGFKLADEATGLTLLVDAGLVVVGAEVVVGSVGVGQQVPHDRQQRVPDRDQRTSLAAAFGHAAVAGAQERVGAGGSDGGLAEGGGQPGVALASGGGPRRAG